MLPLWDKIPDWRNVSVSIVLVLDLCSFAFAADEANRNRLKKGRLIGKSTKLQMQNMHAYCKTIISVHITN
jgi:hypothetical protein